MNDWVKKNPNFYTNGNKTFGLRYNRKTGDFQIRERDSTGGYDGASLETLYQNGSYTTAALKYQDLFRYEPADTDRETPILLPKAEELNKKAREETLQVYRGLGGKSSNLPLNAAANNVNGEPGITNAASQSQIELTPSTDEDNPNNPNPPTLPEVPTVPLPKLPAGIKALKYPIDLNIEHQDILVISQFLYESPYRDIFIPGGPGLDEIIKGGLKRKSALKKALGSLTLPMPNSAADSNSVGWGEDSMDAVTAAATSIISNNKTAALAGITAAEILSKFGGIPNAEKIPRLILLSKILTSAITGGPESEKMVRAAIDSFALNRYQFDVSPESILSRGYGVVPNSNLQLLFQNVSLRGFTFTYLLSPRSKKEAEVVNYILRWFKQGMAAKKKNIQGGSGALLLGTPNVFKLEYKNQNNSIKGINKFKICALTNFNVNYTPGGQWAAYAEGQPSAVSITMSFKEIEPIFDTDYQATAENPDNPPVKDDEVGF